MTQRKKRIPTRVANLLAPKAVFERVAPDTIQVECGSCDSRLFEVFRAPVARKVRVRRAHRFRIMARCVECRKEIRLAFGGLNPL